MKRLFRPFLSIFLLGSLMVTATSCGDDDDPAGPATEDIAEAVLTLDPEGKGQRVTITYSEDSQTPTVSNVFVSNATYLGTLQLFDADGNDITSEIENEAEAHEVFYTPSAGSGVSVEILDKDANNRPLGLEVRLATTTAGTGTLNVLLKHQPNKNATSDKNKGETDLDMTANIVVQ